MGDISKETSVLNRVPIYTYLQGHAQLCIIILHYILVVPITCQSNPCQNGGTCVQSVGGHHCQCVSPYTGLNCEAGECSVLSNTSA